MKRLWAFVVIVGMWTGIGLAQTLQELANDGQTPDDVLTLSMGHDRKSYSPLQQINTSNIKRLVPIWSTSVMNDVGELAAPVVHNGVMYVINGKWTFALDVATGRQIWRTPVDVEAGSGGGTTRGAPALYNGKLFRVTGSRHIVALDMKTGEKIWDQKFAEPKEAFAGGAPIIANGVVISGMAGSDNATRGFLDAWDPDTGKKLWRRYTVPSPGEPGSETWPKDKDMWMYGGAATWRSGSYDPELDLSYWGTGNAQPWDPRPRGELDSLFSNSVLAIRPKTGEIACYFQFTPNDVFDTDANDDLVLADLQIDGRPRKVMIQTNKNGFLYVVDRTDCSLISAHPYTRVNWATHIDLKTGRPVLTDLYKRFLTGEEVEIRPSRGTNAVPIAFNPKTGLVYASTWDTPRIQKLAPPLGRMQVLGEKSTGVVTKLPLPKPGDVPGYFVAMDPLSGKKKWEVPLVDMPGAAGMLVTGGGLVFTGKMTGEFVALDEATGKQLWQFKTSSSINATAITYTFKGRQFVTVASGRGGGLVGMYTGNTVPTGGSIWTFALFED